VRHHSSFDCIDLAIEYHDLGLVWLGEPDLGAHVSLQFWGCGRVRVACWKLPIGMVTTIEERSSYLG